MTISNNVANDRRAYLHIGAPKTGSTYLQNLLWSNRSPLLEAGLHVPGASIADHTAAARDLRGLVRSPDDHRPDWQGSWASLSDLADRSHAASVLITNEHLAGLADEQIGHAVGSLKSRRVHVIYVTRPLTALFRSHWQESVKLGLRLPLGQWTEQMLAESTPRARRFWSENGPVRVVTRWGKSVARQDIHVLILPPSADNQLWQMFCDVMGVDPEVATNREVFANQSLGASEVELLRRVNLRLPDKFPYWHREHICRDLVGNDVLSRRPALSRADLPADIEAKVSVRQENVCKTLQTSGCDIVGDLSALLDTTTSGVAEPDEHTMLEAGAEVISALQQVLESTGDRISGDLDHSPQTIDSCASSIAQLIVRLSEQDDQRVSAAGALSRLRQQPVMRSARSRLVGLADRTTAGASLVDKVRTRLENKRK